MFLFQVQSFVPGFMYIIYKQIRFSGRVNVYTGWFQANTTAAA